MKPLVVRRATSRDRFAIADLTSDAERMVLQVAWADVERALGNHWNQEDADLFVGEQEGQLVCVLGSFVGPDTVAQIRFLALLDGWPVDEVLETLLPPIGRALCEKKVSQLSFIGMEEWLLDGLLAQGFRRVSSIVTMHKSDWIVPGAGNQQVAVRSAAPGDLEQILAIDQAAFEPLWRHTLRALAEQLESCPFFTVAQLDGEIVGYEYATMTGRHGHITRIAVRPDHQGQGIGVRLLAEAVVFFRRRAAFGITLNTQRDNARARRLYDWFGFRPLGKEAEVVVYSYDGCKTYTHSDG